MVSGGAVLVGAGLPGASAHAADRGAALQNGDATSAGTFAQIEYGDAADDFLIQWTRSGGSSSLRLTPTIVRIDVPVWGTAEIDLADFEHGRGEHEIQKYFGPAALEQLRDELSARQIFP